MSPRLADAAEHLSFYHICPRFAQTVPSRASLGVLLNLGDQVDKSVAEKCPFAVYVARYWLTMADPKACRRVSGISPNVCLTQIGPTLRCGSGYTMLTVLGRIHGDGTHNATRGQAAILCGIVRFPQPRGPPHTYTLDGC